MSSYEEFVSGLLILGEDGLSAINSFKATVELPRAHSLDSSEPTRLALGARLFRSVAEILEAAELFAVDNLRLDWADGDVSVIYDDDAFGFRVDIMRDLRIQISRGGCSMKLFHQWYSTIMPYVQGLFSRIGLDLSELLGSEFDLRPLRTQFAYQFLTFDFIPIRGQDPVSSQDLMAPMLSRRPGEDGRLRDVRQAGSVETLRSGRIDLKISNYREITDEKDMHIREVYNIEAPGNQGFRGIWFTFTCIAETYSEGPAGRHVARLRPNADFLLGHYEMPYREFLRDRALGGFLTDFFKDHTFSCTSGYLP